MKYLHVEKRILQTRDVALPPVVEPLDVNLQVK